MRDKTEMKLLRFLAVGIIVLSTGLGNCLAADAQPQEIQALEEQVVAEFQEAPISTVTAIEVRGNKAISGNTVISKMKTRVGQPYQENVASDDIKRLFLLGYFSDIKIDTEPYKDGLKVIVTVEERPIIEKIIFSGIRRIAVKDEKIKESLKSKEGQCVDYPSLAEDIKTLRKMYEKIGYSQVQIDYRVDTGAQIGKVTVTFQITEGKRIKIRSIDVQGNAAIPDKQILRVMKTKRAWLFNAGAYKEDVLQEDMDRIRAFYKKKGFADIEVEHQVRTDSHKPNLYIVVTVKEGKRYYVGTVTLDGNRDVARGVLLAVLKECVSGKVFSDETMQRDIMSLQSAYFDRGYISAQVQEATALNPDTGRVDIVYKISENEITFVDKIKIRGNVKTRDIVIRRELRIRPGDRFDGEKLRRSKERLQNLGFFEEVSYDTEDTSTEAKKDLIVDVKETKTGSFSFGGGYSTVDQLVGFVEIEQKNFDWRNFPYFTGAGQDLKLRSSFGTVSSGFDLSFTEPWLFDYPIAFGFDAYKRQREREEDIGYGYDEDITGGDLRLGKQLTEYINGNITYRFDTIEISNIVEDASADLKKEVGTNNVSSMTFGATFDSRDNVFDTTKGDILSGSMQVAGGTFGGDKDFYKFFGRYSHYFPLINRSSLEVRGRIGLADAYGDSTYIPIFDRFFSGGAYTVRGYNERKLGPIDPASEDPLGGNSMLVANIEYTYPILDFLKAAVFYDAGNVWSGVGDIDAGDLYSGVGLGVRIKTPVGPIMLDYGIPLDKEPGEDDKGSGKFHFSMSHGF